MPVSQTRLRQQLADVPLRSVGRDAQRDSDFGVALPFDQQVEHLALPLIGLPFVTSSVIALSMTHTSIITASKTLSLPAGGNKQTGNLLLVACCVLRVAGCLTLA